MKIQIDSKMRNERRRKSNIRMCHGRETFFTFYFPFQKIFIKRLFWSFNFIVRVPFVRENIVRDFILSLDYSIRHLNEKKKNNSNICVLYWIYMAIWMQKRRFLCSSRLSERKNKKSRAGNEFSIFRWREN